MLQPGETMRIYTQGDPNDDTQFEKHWGMTQPDPQQRRGLGQLVSYTDVRLACTAWGSKSC